MSQQRTEHVVIVGGGFAGLYTAKQLGRHHVPVTLIDRRNYHLFQPLLYQVATAALSPAEIAEPIRKIMRPYRSVRVVMDEVTGIERAHNRIQTREGGALSYSHLIVATGSRPSYFGNDHWSAVAPGLKSIQDATTIRARILAAFERAEIARDDAERDALLTFAVIGGGPTGVELAGSVAEIARHALVEDFRSIDPSRARVILLEGSDKVLSAFDASLQAYALGRLGKLGVEVLLSQKVSAITAEGVAVGDRFIRAETVLWAAGVAASPVGQWLGAPMDRGGRVKVTPRLHLEDDDRVFVLGDLAHVEGADGAPLPGLAQVAKQQGLHLGEQLARQIVEKTEITPFVYKSKGNAAIIGRHAAIFERKLKLRGAPAWFLWALVHVYLLVGFQNRFLVSAQWFWHYLTYERGARLIVDDKGGKPSLVEEMANEPLTPAPANEPAPTSSRVG